MNYLNITILYYTIRIMLILHCITVIKYHAVLVDAPTTVYIHASLCVYFHGSTIYFRFQEDRLQWCVDLFLKERLVKRSHVNRLEIEHNSTLEG